MLRETTIQPGGIASERYPTRRDCVVDHFSNTSDDAYGLQGAFAEIADSLDRANKYIFIVGWMFEPWIHLPCYGEYLRRALHFHHQGNLESAIENYQQIIHKNRDTNGYAAYFLARAYYNQEKIINAKEVLIAAVQKHPSHSDLSFSLAWLYIEVGELEKAKELIQPWVDKQDLDAYAILAEYYRRKGDDVSAEVIYLNILRFDALEQVSKARLAYQGLSSIYLNDKDYKKAEEQFKIGLSFYPQDIHCLVGLARIFQREANDPRVIDRYYLEALGYLSKQPGYKNSALYKKLIKEYRLWAVNHPKITNSILTDVPEDLSDLPDSPEIELRRNIMGFDDGIRRYRDTLPSLGETLIKKALTHPEMVIAINLWQQFTRPGETNRYKYPIQELKQIAIELGLPFPKNILIRTNHCRDLFNSHHQKYFVMDDGREGSAAYVGSCDLSAKFDWAEHPIINTAENDFAIDRHFYHHDFENLRFASRRVDLSEHSDMMIPRGPWREVISRIKGSICDDLFKEFKARWTAGAGGALSGCNGQDDNDLVATFQTGVVEVTGSLDLTERLKLKKEGVYNTVNIYKNQLFWNKHVYDYKYELTTAQPVPTVSMQVIKLEIYNDAYERLRLHKKELIRFQKKHRLDLSGIAERRKNLEEAKKDYYKLITSHLCLSTDENNSDFEEEFKNDDTLCAARVITSTQKNYYKSNWLLGSNIDHSILDSYVTTIRQARNFIYIENQYFVCDYTTIPTNPIVKAIIDKIIVKAKQKEPFHVFLNLPYSPNGEPGDGVFIDPLRKTEHEIFYYMMRTIEENTHQVWSQFLSIHFFAQWNGVNSQKANRLKEANAISRVESQSISQRAPIYNHAKLLIADGTIIINGSANISERSMSGKSDTELAIIQTSIPEEKESRRKMEFFTLKIVRQYYGEVVANNIEQRLAQGLGLGLGDPEIVALIQQNTWDNLKSFCSNEPGYAASKDKGYAVSFPYKREFGHSGQIAEGFEFIPDAPRNAEGQHPDAYRWVPQNGLPRSLAFARWTGKTS